MHPERIVGRYRMRKKYQTLLKEQNRRRLQTSCSALLTCLIAALLLLPTNALAEGPDPYFDQSDYYNVAEEAEDAVILLEGDHGTLSDTTRGKSGNPVIIERKGIYLVTGRSEGVTILVREPRKSGNIYLVLDNVFMTTSAGPCIESEAAEKTIIQCVGDSRLVSLADKGAAITAADALTLNGTGRLQIESGKNGIHSRDTLRITGAALTVRAENDGLKGKRGVLIDGGSITIERSYEGLEGSQVLLRSGDLRVFSSDDGINAADEDLPGDVVVSGGTLYINAIGDAIDSNRSIFFEGGTTLVEGPENGRNSIFDKGDGDDTVLSISGGTVLAIGSAEKAKNFTAGTQYSRLEPVSGHAGDVISADDGSGVTLTASKDFDCVIYSSPGFTADNSIQLASSSSADGQSAPEWDTSVSPEITDEIRTLISAASAELPGVNYEPIAVLGRQGERCCILCRATAVYPGAEPYHALVYLDVGAEKPGISGIREIWLDENR